MGNNHSLWKGRKLIFWEALYSLIPSKIISEQLLYGEQYLKLQKEQNLILPYKKFII